ncbi:MAG: baeRF7 domain-containing protein [Senegalia sp. (in: firmicutes)]|uniref:baeRF7 domain-containing protein n=1 Tax=Senegalia sp. (in: firmicutes) TaxID=1924098 RepID=UPI003F99D406
MDIMKKEQLRTLIEKKEKHMVSIYIPTVDARIEAKQGQIKLKNALRDASNKLEEQKLDKKEIEEILEPAEKYVDENEFWLDHSDGLVLFMTKYTFTMYKLPIEFEQTVVVSDKFYIKPLLPLFTGDGTFFILSASKNDVRLFQATRDSISKIILKDTPLSLDEAMKYDDFEKELQHNTMSNRNMGSDSPIYHGTGDGDEDEKNQILRFFQLLDKGIRNQIEEENIPLIFAGVDYLFPIYKEANKYNNLVDRYVSGNPDRKSDKELHKEAWKEMEPIFKEEQKADQGNFKELEGTGKSSKDIREIVPAAHFGKVDTLFVSLTDKLWGQFHPKFNKANLIEEENEEEAIELLNYAAMQTILNGGKVYGVNSGQVPGGEKIAAIYRY